MVTTKERVPSHTREEINQRIREADLLQLARVDVA